jgi:hypothetical protein
LPTRHHGLTGKREAWTPLNFPPASVWRYTSTSVRELTSEAAGR